MYLILIQISLLKNLFGLSVLSFFDALYHLDSAAFDFDIQLFRESPDFSGGDNEPGIT